MILVDTSVLVDFFKGVPSGPAARFQRLLEGGVPFGITSVVYQEILQGARSETEYAKLKRYLETQRFYHPLDPIQTYEEAARIFFGCRRAGVTIRSTIDCLIARIAIERDLLLLHNDSDFDAISRVIPLKILDL
jgi:predicted nucleic acid-binding protein